MHTNCRATDEGKRTQKKIIIIQTTRSRNVNDRLNLTKARPNRRARVREARFRERSRFDERATWNNPSRDENCVCSFVRPSVLRCAASVFLSFLPFFVSLLHEARMSVACASLSLSLSVAVCVQANRTSLSLSPLVRSLPVKEKARVLPRGIVHLVLLQGVASCSKCPLSSPSLLARIRPRKPRGG